MIVIYWINSMFFCARLIQCDSSLHSSASRIIFWIHMVESKPKVWIVHFIIQPNFWPERPMHLSWLRASFISAIIEILPQVLFYLCVGSEFRNFNWFLPDERKKRGMTGGWSERKDKAFRSNLSVKATIRYYLQIYSELLWDFVIDESLYGSDFSLNTYLIIILAHQPGNFEFIECWR